MGSHIDDLRGAGKLAIEAIRGVTSLVEEMHRTIGSGPAVLGKPLQVPTAVVTGAAYGAVRAAANLVGSGIDAALGQLSPLLDGKSNEPSAERAAVLAALNGVLGDYLVDTNNALAIDMRLREVHTDTKGAADKLLVMVHGACMNDRQWRQAGHDHGAAMARDLGYTPIYLHYNSGQHVSTNGAEFAVLLDEFVSSQGRTVEEIVILAHSMGGLVARAAVHQAETRELGWRAKLRAMIFLGTPHHGSPLERGGNWIDGLLGVSRYSAPFARLGRIRSAGVTDLRFGSVLDEHWQGHDRFAMAGDKRSPMALPKGVDCFAIAASKGEVSRGKRRGDGLVPVQSALGIHPDSKMTLRFPRTNTWIAPGIGHRDLLASIEVYDTIRSWISAALDSGRTPD